MVELVDGLVEAGRMQGSVEPVMPRVFKDEEDGNLIRHGEDGGKWNRERETYALSEWMEKPDLWELDGKMREQDVFRARPLFGCRWRFLVLELVFSEPGEPIRNEPNQRAAKVDGFMHDEGHDAGSQYIILHIGIPCRPHTLHEIEVAIVLRYLLKLAPIGDWLG